MRCRVNLASPLWKYSGNQAEFEIEGDTVRQVLSRLEEEAPGMKDILTGPLRDAIRIYLNNDDIEMLEKMDTAIKAGDELYISPVLTGG